MDLDQTMSIQAADMAALPAASVAACVLFVSYPCDHGRSTMPSRMCRNLSQPFDALLSPMPCPLESL